MATADELLMTAAESSEEILVVDLNTRVISIPATLKILGVESDDDVKLLQFKIPRYYGEFDLSTFDIRINFENARGKGDFYPVDNITINTDDTFTFTWLVDRVAFERAGDVRFSICMKLYNSNGEIVKEWNTTYATLPVLEGLETEKTVIEQNPSAFDRVMYRLCAVEAATGNGEDGYYSVVRVDQTENGVLFTIVNQDGETIAYVRHGIDGVDGYTPQKGIDYWTPEDKTEVRQQVQTYVNSWAPVYKTVILTSTGWSNNAQNVTIPGVTPDCIVFVSPSADSDMEYANATVRCVSQGTNQLTFQCKTVPTTAIKINIAVYHSKEEFTNGITVTDDGQGNVTIM